MPRMPDSVERLDLLLIHEARTRRVRTDGIHLHNFRYLSLTLAAYVGEDVTIRFDPRDMGEIRVFYGERFLCRAISADLAGQIVPLREIVNARKRGTMKLRFGWGPIDGAAGMIRNVELIETAREVIGYGIDLMVDAYMGGHSTTPNACCPC